jgi:hypothetical protein
MKTPLASAPVVHDHPPQPTPQPTYDVPSHPVRRVGLLDRAALHLGVALIRWGSRPSRTDRRERPPINIEAEKVRQKAIEYRDHHPTVNPMRFW